LKPIAARKASVTSASAEWVLQHLGGATRVDSNIRLFGDHYSSALPGIFVGRLPLASKTIATAEPMVRRLVAGGGNLDPRSSATLVGLIKRGLVKCGCDNPFLGI